MRRPERLGLGPELLLLLLARRERLAAQDRPDKTGLVPSGVTTTLALPLDGLDPLPS